MRKNLLLPLLFFLLSYSAHAQLSAGSWMLGGGFGLTTGSSTSSFSTTNMETTSRTFNFSLAPRIGYFVHDRIAIGMGLGYGRTMNRSGENREQLTIYSGGPFARVYHMVSERAGFFGQGSLGYSARQARQRTDGGDWRKSPVSSNEFSLNVFPGFTYFVHNKLGAELALGGLYYAVSNTRNTDQNTTNRTSGLGFNISLSGITFGLNYFINR
jgi:hypothetical protein